MEHVISTEKKPIKAWASKIEDSALKQARNLANLPFTHKHVALMPDVHTGYGMPIGGVLATKGVIIPNAVGVDIGCGMLAMKTTLKTIEFKDLKRIYRRIKQEIPMKFGKHHYSHPEGLMPSTSDVVEKTIDLGTSIVLNEYDNARQQLGTLGGGNHFVELQKDSTGSIWLMIHSGSRNIGAKVAKHYNKAAKELNNQWHSKVDPEINLAFLPLNSSIGKAYKAEMEFCMKYAKTNRQLIAATVLRVINEVINNCEDKHIVEKDFDVAHNYARLEHHFGEDVVVHRKGATSAKEDQIGIIPGSQGTQSYIVRGKGNVNSFKSCSHGAGRAMSRTKALMNLDLNVEKATMDVQGIVHGMSALKKLDEAPGAYKDIEEVMAAQEDLVDIEHELTPILSVKG